MSKIAAVLLALSLTLIVALAASCGDASETKISSADEHLTYGDTLGQDADEMLEMLENS